MSSDQGDMAAATGEPVIDRLDRLASRFVSRIVGREPTDVEDALDETLEELGESLSAGETRFESAADGTPTGERVRAWIRPGGIAGHGEAHRIPVTVHGRLFFLLSVLAVDLRPWPAALDSRLQLLADLMGLALRQRQQAHELQLTRNELASANACGAQFFNQARDTGDFEEIIGDSPTLRIAQGRVQEVAPTDASVMILGETGTGKELFARAVHKCSARRDRPFIRVNCAALPPTLIESELFGHERGAFTGAVAMRQGRFELAHRGTLFLDEIGDLPADVQSKLLRVLQEGEFERVGSSQSRRVDVRVIAATHRDLDEALREGQFRADLYYRLNVFPIVLPPLRERIDDIPRLVWFFVNRRQRALNRKFTSIPASVLAALQQHSWPGNVRELENVVERAMIHSTGSALLLDDSQVLQLPAGSRDAGTLESIERRHIEEALRRCRWRINGQGNAADVLGLHPNTLRFRMKKLGIQRPAAAPSVVRDFNKRLLA